MKVLRTPDERFQTLPHFPYSPNYSESLRGFEGLRMHWLDEGPSQAAHTFLCLHGQPTWSYLYRKMIPVFLAAGHRIVAPDFFGFGRSDKPADDSSYTFDFHRRSLIAFVEQLDLRNITLVCQDWGGLLGLTIPMDMVSRFTRLLVMNTALGTGDHPLSQGFAEWRSWANKTPDMQVGKLMRRSCPHLKQEEAAAYDAPFPDASYKAGVRRFPNLVPDRIDAEGADVSRRAREWWRSKWTGKTFMAVGATDPVLGEPAMFALKKDILGCPEPLIVKNAGHFVQEWGEEIAIASLAAFGDVT